MEQNIRSCYGTFKNADNTKQYRVSIYLNDDGTLKQIVDPLTTNFDADNDNIMFDRNPVVISCERSEMTQQILIRQARINLKANFDLSDMFFADTNRSKPVIIEQKVGNEWVDVFDGYIDPLQFKQNAAYNYESYTINCTDPLGALEDLKVNQLPTLVQSDTPTLKELLTECMTAIGCDIDFSKWETSPNQMNDDLITNMSIYYGDSADDYKTLNEIVQNILIYHGGIMYYNPATKKVIVQNMYIDDATSVNFDFVHNVMDSSSAMSMSDAFNRVKLSCNIEPLEEDIDMLDDDTLESDYPSYQKYMTELVSPGDGKTAYAGFRQLLDSDELEEYTTYECGFAKENFVWIKKSSKWDFGPNGYDKQMAQSDQSDWLSWMKQDANIGKGMFVAYGNTDKIQRVNKSPISSINMTDYLQIAINGHCDDSPTGHINQIISRINQNSPICTYTGPNSVTLTPTDNNMTNYIIISGKVLLNPLQQRSGRYPENRWSTHLKDDVYQKSQGVYHAAYYFRHTVPSYDDNKYGMYYAQKFWRCTDAANPVYTYKRVNTNPMIGFLNIDNNKEFQYMRGSYNDDSDTIKKMPVLCCELKVGDKYCCERLDLGPGGQNVFEWHTLSELSGTSIKPWITIGFDPKIEDYIVGQVHDISNNISHTMNLDGQSGMAIPVKMSDNLSGQVEFKILKPYNLQWSEYNFIVFYIPDTITPYFTNTKYVLEHIESIMLQDFKLNFVSNNNMIRKGMTTSDNDLVYMSNMDNTYNEDSESETIIVTPLTIEECIRRGVKYQMSSSYVYHSDTTPFLGWTYGNNQMIRPEEAWVDYMWYQMHTPRKILSTNIKDTVLTNQQSYSTDMGYWMTCGMISGTIGSEESNFSHGYLTRVEWDLKNRSMDMDIREAADYTPVW